MYLFVVSLGWKCTLSVMYCHNVSFFDNTPVKMYYLSAELTWCTCLLCDVVDSVHCLLYS